MRIRVDAVGLFVVVAMAATGCAGQNGGNEPQSAEAASTQAVSALASATSVPASPIPPTHTPTTMPTETSAPQPANNSALDDYGYGLDDYGIASTPTADKAAPASGPATVGSVASSLGVILVDGQGRTLYALTMDSPGVSTCEGSCLQNWPPLLAAGTPTAGDGVQAPLLGTLVRGDGTTQVTYSGKPLYTFAGDLTAGQLNGQAKGGVWFAVTATGDFAR